MTRGRSPFHLCPELSPAALPPKPGERWAPAASTPEAFLQEALMGLWSLEVGVGAVCLAVRLKTHLESVTQLAVGGEQTCRDRGRP